MTPAAVLLLTTPFPHLSQKLGMLFTLSVGLHNVPLAPEDKTKASAPYQVRYRPIVLTLIMSDSVLFSPPRNELPCPSIEEYAATHNIHPCPLFPCPISDLQKFSTFSLLLADTVRINAEGIPEILTKIAKDFVSVSYNINDKVWNREIRSLWSARVTHRMYFEEMILFSAVRNSWE
jgi:hypothetical protein